MKHSIQNFEYRIQPRHGTSGCAWTRKLERIENAQRGADAVGGMRAFGVPAGRTGSGAGFRGRSATKRSLEVLPDGHDVGKGGTRGTRRWEEAARIGGILPAKGSFFPDNGPGVPHLPGSSRIFPHKFFSAPSEAWNQYRKGRCGSIGVLGAKAAGISAGGWRGRSWAEKREIFHGFSRFSTFYHRDQARNSAISALFRVGAIFRRELHE